MVEAASVVAMEMVMAEVIVMEMEAAMAAVMMIEMVMVVETIILSKILSGDRVINKVGCNRKCKHEDETVGNRKKGSDSSGSDSGGSISGGNGGGNGSRNGDGDGDEAAAIVLMVVEIIILSMISSVDDRIINEVGCDSSCSYGCKNCSSGDHNNDTENFHTHLNLAAKNHYYTLYSYPRLEQNTLLFDSQQKIASKHCVASILQDLSKYSQFWKILKD